MRIKFELIVETPLKIGSPKPPAPINAARVAVPITITAAVRTPDKMNGKAKGISIFNSI